MDLTRFDWDENNIRKVERHRIMPEEAEQVLAVALTVREERIRVITAYDLEANQKRDHDEQTKIQVG